MQFVDIFVAVCNLAETMLDPPDYQLAAECRYMPEVYGTFIKFRSLYATLPSD